MNKVNKGYRTEKRCKDELEAQGYLVWKTMRVAYANIDLWGIFDVAALAPNGSHIMFIQCKTNRCDNATKERIGALKMPLGCSKWIWIWRDRNGWEKINCSIFSNGF